MFHVTINRQPCEAPEGSTILQVLHRQGITVPTLCHDDRLHPTGACRLCVVAVKGREALVSACNTALQEGMEIETHSPAVEDTRRTLLRLLAADYPATAFGHSPDKPFHHWLRHYDIAAQGSGKHAHFTDTTHPYMRVDMERCITCSRCVRICDEVQGQFVWRTWHRGDATRILPHQGSSLLESDCVSCGACADTCPTGAIEDKPIPDQDMLEKWTRTTCPYCGTGCEMLVGTRGDRIVEVKPVLDAPVNKGHLCVKGRYAFGFTHSPDRVREPMIRKGSEWHSVTWEHVNEWLAEQLQGILKAHGPQSIGMLGSARSTNEENYVAQKFSRVALGTNNIDCCARVCHAPTAVAMKRMLGTGAATNSFDDIEHAASFLICGCNPTEAHPIIGARIKQTVLRGAPLIVIDPRATELTRYANVHLALRPGTNIPLLNALAHVILAESLADTTALDQRISGCNEFREFIQQWTPERAAALCGVKAEDIRTAARIYATSAPAMAFHGLGMTEHVQGTEGVMTLVNLALLTGNFGKPGSGVNPLRGQNNVQGAAHMGCEPGHLTGFIPIEQGRDAFSAAWKSPLPALRGLNLMEMMDGAERSELKALWAIGYDVSFTNPDTIRTHAALETVDLVIVQDLFFNELARKFGHVFLPAASPFEKDGTFMNSERRIQRVRRAIPAPGHAKADWEIVRDVARTMGFATEFPYNSAEEIWDEIRSVWKAGAGISYSRIEHGGLQWPCPEETHPGTSILHQETFAGSKTAPLQCIDFQESSEAVTTEFPFLLTTGRNLYHFNAGTMTMRTPNRELHPTDTLDISNTDATRLGLDDGETICITSRHGTVEIPLHIDPRIKEGQLFATFHSGEIGLNRLTGQGRDKQAMTPEYKVIAVRIDKKKEAVLMPEIFGFDCYSPREIAERVETVGVTKANLPITSMVALGVLAGGFIGLGAMFATLVLCDSGLSFAVGRVLAGVVFSLGLILVVIAGAELFTGNNLLVMSYVAGSISLGKLLANFTIVYVANFIGAAGLAIIIYLSSHADMGDGAVGRTAVAIATTKVALPFAEAFFRGVLCNILVCLAVWLAMAGRTVTDKILAIIFPITAFVAAGFEHSVANMYFIPLGIFLGADISMTSMLHNLVPVTLGNLVGGSGMVGLVYHTIYRRSKPSSVPPSTPEKP